MNKLTKHRKRKPIVYLAGAINKTADSECVVWREIVTEKLKDTAVVLNPLRRDYRNSEMWNIKEIVELDKKDIDRSDFIIVYWKRPSCGTSMEVLYGWERCKTIITILLESNPSPWIVYHSHHIVKSIDDAVKVIKHACKGGAKMSGRGEAEKLMDILLNKRQQIFKKIYGVFVGFGAYGLETVELITTMIDAAKLKLLEKYADGWRGNRE